jgi:predicted Na+-dependent transporter
MTNNNHSGLRPDSSWANVVLALLCLTFFSCGSLYFFDVTDKHLQATAQYTRMLGEGLFWSLGFIPLIAWLVVCIIKIPAIRRRLNTDDAPHP